MERDLKMTKFEIREIADNCNCWSKCEGTEWYDAAESFAESYDDEGYLTEGNTVNFEIREVGSEKIRKISLYATVYINYYANEIEEN